LGDRSALTAESRHRGARHLASIVRLTGRALIWLKYPSRRRSIALRSKSPPIPWAPPARRSAFCAGSKRVSLHRG